eukprot:scaffold110937_cov40-Cyclotella_meneghiniana.AAC.1
MAPDLLLKVGIVGLEVGYRVGFDVGFVVDLHCLVNSMEREAAAEGRGRINSNSRRQKIRLWRFGIVVGCLFA